MEDARHSVHLNHVLDINLNFQALLRNLKLLVAVQETSALSGFTTTREAAAEGFGNGDNGVGAVPRVEIHSLLDLGS